jgi:thioredoxin reductase (NADPH)
MTPDHRRKQDRNWTLIIYSRQGCHLCDVMKNELESMDLAQTGSITMVDIDTDPEFARRFNDLVPVLFVNDKEVCHYKLNKERLLAILGSE